MSSEEFEQKYGQTYSNALTRHALKTLDKFLKNLLTPVWIRDVPYNIKGQMTPNEAYAASKYKNNLKITQV